MRSRLLSIPLVILLATASAQAEPWQPAPQRQRQYVDLANRVGLPRATQRAVDALNRAYGLRLSTDQVRIVPFTKNRTFWSFVDHAKQSALGVGVTPHAEGPHPHLLVGDRLYDGIQPGWTNGGRPARYRDGTMMRKDSFGTPHGTQRLFCLFKAPTSSLTAVGQAAERLYQDRRNVGYNCALLATEQLAQEGRRAGGSPFATLQPSPLPPRAMSAVMRARPDLLIQVLPDKDFDRAMADPNHLVKLWGNQQL